MTGQGSELVEAVERRGELPNQVTPEDAIEAVMCTLTERLTAGEVHELVQSLPPGVRPLFTVCELHRDGMPTAKFDRVEMLERVAVHLGITPAQAELVCRAVFAAVRSQLPAKAIEHVANQLPHELKDLWRDVLPLAWPPESPEEEDVIRRIEDDAALPVGVTGRDALSAVMCTLSERLSGGEARKVFLMLPERLRNVLRACMLHREERPVTLDRNAFIETIAHHLETTDADAEAIARVVIGAVRAVLPAKESLDIAAQLPADLRSFWESS